AGPLLADLAGLQVASRHVGQEHLDGRVGAGELEPGGPAHRAAPAVAADQVAADQPAGALRGLGLDLDPVAGGVQPHDPPAPPYLRAELGRPLAQHGLGARLRDTACSEVRVRQHAEVQRYTAEMPACAGLDVPEPGQQPALVEYFHRAG